MAAADVRLRRVLRGNSLLTNDGDYNETQALILSPGPLLPRPDPPPPGTRLPRRGRQFYVAFIIPPPPPSHPRQACTSSSSLTPPPSPPCLTWACGRLLWEGSHGGGVAFIFGKLQVTEERMGKKGLVERGLERD